MDNRHSRRRKGEDDKYRYRRYLENSKGDLVDLVEATGLSRLTPSLLHYFTYPASPVYNDECADPGMRPEMLRYGTFRGASLNSLPATPFQLAAGGFYYRAHTGSILCFCCGRIYPHHHHECRHAQLTIPFHLGVGQPPPPPTTLQDFTRSGRVVLRSVFQPVGPQTALPQQAFNCMYTDISLGGRGRYCQATTEDDHNISPGRLGAAAQVSRVSRSVPALVHQAPSSGPVQGPAPQATRSRSSPVIIPHSATSRESTPRTSGHGRLCKVCQRRPVLTQFLPCRHTVCCVVCGFYRPTCPECGQIVSDTVPFERM